MIKQIAIVAILGLALVLATAAVYTESAFAFEPGNYHIHTQNGINGGGGQTSPGLTTACAHPNVASHNPNC